MGVFEGLGAYAIFKQAITLILLIICLGISVYFTIVNINKNYVSTQICNIKSNPDKTQVLTYVANGVQFTKNINSVTQTSNNVTTVNYAYSEGRCKLYYPSANPDEYYLTYNPTTVLEIITVVLFIIFLLSILFFVFLTSSPEGAGVVGGIEAAGDLFSLARNRW